MDPAAKVSCLEGIITMILAYNDQGSMKRREKCFLGKKSKWGEGDQAVIT